MVAAAATRTGAGVARLEARARPGASTRRQVAISEAAREVRRAARAREAGGKGVAHEVEGAGYRGDTSAKRKTPTPVSFHTERECFTRGPTGSPVSLA